MANPPNPSILAFIEALLSGRPGPPVFQGSVEDTANLWRQMGAD